ncbi:hypothetical protein J6590_056214 [Homalodisca vitripennis]|nr:hypothetical protein J6590_056214 [Homalodisca vitripennis]
MPKSNLNVFRKRKRVFTGQHVHSKSEVVSEVVDNLEELQSRPSSSSTSVDSEVCNVEPTTISSSSSKISSNFDAYSAYEDCDKIKNCYDLVSVQLLQNLMSQIVVCSKCQGALSLYSSNRLGLSFKLNLKCNDCNYQVSEKNSPTVNKVINQCTPSLCFSMHRKRGGGSP